MIYLLYFFSFFIKKEKKKSNKRKREKNFNIKIKMGVNKGLVPLAHYGAKPHVFLFLE